MPLIKSPSDKAFKSNVKTLMGEIGKSPHVQSREQALAIAYSTKRRSKKADGGSISSALSTARRYGKKKALGGPNLSMENMVMKGSSYGLRHEGMINSSIPGRTDKLPMNVKSGSYVLPADIPSALGQGNSMAGGQILKKMFSSGPYGMAPMRGAGRSGQPRMSMKTPRAPKGMFADGGEAEGDDHVPIIAAGGEYIIHPDVVRDVGHGDIKAGHKVLDKFVLQVRNHNIKTLKKLPGPKK